MTIQQTQKVNEEYKWNYPWQRRILHITSSHLRNVNVDDVINRRQGRSTRQRERAVTRK